MAISLSAIERGDDSGHKGELGVVRLERELDRDAVDVGYDGFSGFDDDEDMFGSYSVVPSGQSDKTRMIQRRLA
nr:hypothetical protein [Tanacetum cinerariifolium]